ncbi:MAG TPA: DUF1801 domain-containing protein [Puia sp.]|nr:DUF1801 domain-containing protein [Puia sp.]
MQAPSRKFKTVDEYLSTFPEPTRNKLRTLRDVIKKAAPGAQEIISYNMPAIKQHGVLVYYAGYKGHIGFYPTGSGIEAFQKELSAYESSKGAVKFPLDETLPAGLIGRIVKFRVKQDQEKAKIRAAKKK